MTDFKEGRRDREVENGTFEAKEAPASTSNGKKDLQNGVHAFGVTSDGQDGSKKLEREDIVDNIGRERDHTVGVTVLE